MSNQFTHPWTDSEKTFLLENYKTMSYKDIGQTLNRSYSSVQSYIRNVKIKKRINKHQINSNFFKIWSPEMAYVLGFITADGNLQQIKKGYHLHIACDDFDIIEKIRTCLNSTTPVRKKIRFNGKISYSLRFSDKIIFEDLLLLGLTPRKSLTVQAPRVPKKYLWAYIRGLFDGDGCVYINQKSSYPSKLHVLFYTGSFLLADFLLEAIKYYLKEYKGTIIKREKRGVFNYKLHFGQKHSEAIFNYMYNNATIYMARKYDIFLKGISYEPRLT